MLLAIAQILIGVLLVVAGLLAQPQAEPTWGRMVLYVLGLAIAFGVPCMVERSWCKIAPYKVSFFMYSSALLLYLLAKILAIHYMEIVSYALGIAAVLAFLWAHALFQRNRPQP